MAVQIDHAQFPEDFEVIHALFLGYATSLGIDLTFQSFQEELDSIPGKYATSEGGALLIARAPDASNASANLNASHDVNLESSKTESILFDSNTLPSENAVLGCVALRSSSDGWCEMKRLYVLPEARGLQLGDKLVEAILSQAKSLGYRGIRLDTLPDMLAAQRLYRKHGFVETEPYYCTPLQNTIFLECNFTREY